MVDLTSRIGSAANDVTSTDRSQPNSFRRTYQGSSPGCSCIATGLARRSTSSSSGATRRSCSSTSSTTPGLAEPKLEYGYRGTPTTITLGFDAAADFHLYEIDWQPNHIAWKVDGMTVYERTLWNPTPIPDRPLAFNLNLWHSRSTEFAGRLDTSRLPTHAEVRSIVLTASES